MLANMRRYMHLAANAAMIQGGMSKIWQEIRTLTTYTHETYEKVKIIAQKKGVDIPKPLVNMDVETS